MFEVCSILNLDLCGIVGRMTVTQAVAYVAKRQGSPSLAGIPQLVVAGKGRQLYINLAAGVPEQPGDGIGVPLGMLVELLGIKAG